MHSVKCIKHTNTSTPFRACCHLIMHSLRSIIILVRQGHPAPYERK
nr:MAG TPA: hypothetical protein [Caudoviricetes sp.]